MEGHSRQPGGGIPRKNLGGGAEPGAAALWPMKKPIPGETIQRILVVGETPIGDALLSTPAVHALKRSFPNARITYITSKPGREALFHNPDIDEFVIYEPGIYQEIAREKPFDLAVNLMNSVRLISGEVLCLLAGATYRIGMSTTSLIKKGPPRVYNFSPDEFSTGKDVIGDYLNPVRALGGKTISRRANFYLTKEERKFGRTFLKDRTPIKALLIGLQPGGHSKRELWDPRKFSSLADTLIDRLRANILLFQGPGEEKICASVYGRIKVKEKALILPVLPLRQYASLVNRCQVFIAHDRGPMHMAASLGVKTIGIFTRPIASYYFPYRNPKRYIYIQKKGARQVTVEEVFKAAMIILSSHDSAKFSARPRAKV